MALRISREHPTQPEIVDLLAAAERYSASLYPAESNDRLSAFALSAAHIRFLVARDESGRAVATGALALGKCCAELKAMWVMPVMRGKGLSKVVLQALEAIARNEGVRRLQLETGIDNHAALALYQRAGFSRCGPFGDYRPDPLSIFMQKNIDADTRSCCARTSE